jgi:flagellar biosynthesis/type III secretory pathway protein FliH
MKKTAVEWLYEQILLTPLDIRSINKCLEQAKEIEEEIIKKEREEAYKNGYANGQMDAFTK